MFKIFLSPESRKELEHDRCEARRLHGLTDHWLAAALLKMAREARRSAAVAPDSGSYSSLLLFALVPELARRLGSVGLQPCEVDPSLQGMPNHKLRLLAGTVLANVDDLRDAAGRLLTREACNGNPVVYAIDRLCPGALGDPEDRLTRSIAEIAGLRDVAYAGTWTLEMLG